MERRAIEKLTDGFMAQFREVFRERRERLALRRCDVAERSGLSPQMITYCEEAERKPLLVSYVRLCLSMGVKPSELMLLVEERLGLHDGPMPEPPGAAPSRTAAVGERSIPV